MHNQEVLLPQAEWDAAYAGEQLTVAAPDDPLRAWLTRHLRGRIGACLEFGCFPGRFLAVLGELGLELNGIDLTPRVAIDLPEWLISKGFKVGTIKQGDVFQEQWPRLFDVGSPGTELEFAL